MEYYTPPRLDNWLWDEECLERNIKTTDGTKSQYHVYVLEANLALNNLNVHERCNLGARSRWCIETSMLVEKHHGYQYEHCFSYDWNVIT